MKALVLMLLAATPWQAGTRSLQREEPLVTMETVDGQRWYTVRATNTSIERVLDEIGTLSDRTIEGFEGLERTALVTIELDRRPVDQVLEYMLGSVGMSYELRRDTITVHATPPDSGDADGHLGRASAAWLRAITRFPGHPHAAMARLAQGEIAEMRGMLGAARNYYQTLVEDYPRAEAVGEAYMRSGRIAARLGQWADASLQFRTLANLSDGAEYHAMARLELARCSVELGDPQSALHILTALEANYPASDAVETTVRVLVRAHALNGLGQHMEALRELDRVDGRLDPIGSWEATRIRAVGLEGIDLPGEAGRAWLVYSRDAEGRDRSFALQQAARLALEAEDELGALFVCREAQRLGMDDGLGLYWAEARRRLGFDVGGSSQGSGALDRLERAEGLLEEQDYEGASAAFESLFLARGALDEATNARVCAGWAACVDQSRGLEAALGVLFEARPSFDSLEFRSEIDVAAAALLEKHGELDRAIDAYRGSFEPRADR